MERWIERETLYQGPIFSVTGGRVELPDGAIARRDVLEHPGGVAIVPVIGEDVWLVRQYRVALAREMIELPAGRREPGETAAASAARELAEELGRRAGRLLPVGSFFSSPGYTNDRTAIFLGLDLDPVPVRPVPGEYLQILRVPIVELPALVASGEICDAKTVIGIFALFAYQGRSVTLAVNP